MFVYCVDVTNIKNSKWYKEDMPFRNKVYLVKRRLYRVSQKKGGSQK